MSFNLLGEPTEPRETQEEVQVATDVPAFTVDIEPDVVADERVQKVAVAGEAPALSVESPITNIEGLSEAQEDHDKDNADNEEKDEDDGDNEDAESDSDAEDWDEISKGRYFGADSEKESGPLCHNCKQAGHKKKDCPHQLCRSCGALDDHDTMRCPMTQRCYNCSRLGHVASKCPEPHRQSGSYCKECGSKAHLARSCPQIWRLYLPASDFDPDGDWSVEAWCYNCAARGHYGDDCPKQHRVRLLEPTAFCQGNQPESRSARRVREAREKKDAERYRRLDEEERQEDWFLRQTGNAHSFRPGTNHNSFQNGNTSYGYPPPPPTPTTRGSRRFDPYARPAGPIITSERYPRGMPPHNSRGRPSSASGSSSHKRKPVPAAERLAKQNQSSHRSSTRGGKPYRGGGRR